MKPWLHIYKGNDSNPEFEIQKNLSHMSGKKEDIYRHAQTQKFYLLGTLPQEANGGCTPVK